MTQHAKNSEKSVNFELERILRTKHPGWTVGVEQTQVLRGQASRCPDMLVRPPTGGLPVIVETEYAPATTVEDDALTRLGQILQDGSQCIEQVVALRLPVELSMAKQSELGRKLSASEFKFCLFSGDPANPDRWPAQGWIDGDIDDLVTCIELATLAEDRIVRGLAVLEQGIADTAYNLRSQSVDTPGTLIRMAEYLHQEDSPQTTRMGIAIIANAMIFQTAIAGARSKDGSFRIAPLGDLRNQFGWLSKHRMQSHWRDILDKINYWPIFNIASDILKPIPDGKAQAVLDRLAEVASELAALGTTGQHNLSGRMFQRLISDRKFLATFYTRPASAALLAELAVARLTTDWSSASAVCALRVGDFACGTGALLNASYQAIRGRYRRHDGDDREIHARMMETALVGTDIMPAATHLTTSVLSSAHANVTFAKTHIITLPYGQQPEKTGRPIALGALDLMKEEKIRSLFGTGQHRLHGTVSGADDEADLPHDSFDLVIMNPPFTRPTNHKITEVPIPSFAGFATSEEEQRRMSVRLKALRNREMVGNGHAGLASNFMDLAHAKIRNPGGVLALVLPAVCLQGESWSAARQLLATHYHDVTIISIATSSIKDSAFSADTGMAEVLIVATRGEAETDGNMPVLFVNLHDRPRAILDAVMTARIIHKIPGKRISSPMVMGTEKPNGCYIRGDFSQTGAAGAKQLDVIRSAAALAQGHLSLPRMRDAISLAVSPLEALGNRGLLHREISDGEARMKTGPNGLPLAPFTRISLEPDAHPTWPMLWNHSAQRETRLVVEPDSEGIIRPGCDNLAHDVWRQTASCLHFSLDFRLSSQPLAACLTPGLTIGGTAWPNVLCTNQNWEKPLVLWANSTLGLMAFWWIGSRQHLGRARLTISKLPSLPVLDTRQLTEEQLNRADDIFAAFCGRELRPANEAWRDEVRQELDQAVLIDLLGLDAAAITEPLALLRRQWCAEPSVHGGKNTAPS